MTRNIMKKKHMYRNYVEFDKDLKLYEVVDHYYPEKTLNLSKRNAEGVRKSISENKDLAEFHTLKDFSQPPLPCLIILSSPVCTPPHTATTIHSH